MATQLVSVKVRTDCNEGQSDEKAITISPTTTTTTTSTTTTSSTTTTTPSACSGNIDLSLSPNPVLISSTVTATADSLSNCNSKTVYIKDYNNCSSGLTITSCTSTSIGCSSTFTSPTSSGQYGYYSCIDKNLDGDFLDSGEQSAKVILNVNPTTTTTTSSTSTTTTTKITTSTTTTTTPTTTSTTASTSTTTTTAPPSSFNSTYFNTTNTTSGYDISFSYNNLLQENATVLFLMINEQGLVIDYFNKTVLIGSGSISNPINCTSLGNGNYIISWEAYLGSDNKFLDIKSWSKPNQWMELECI